MHTDTDLIFLWILKIKFLEVGNNSWGNRNNCEFWKPSWQRIIVFAMRLLGLGGGLLLIIVKSIKPKCKYMTENMNSFTQQLQALLRIMLYFFSCVWGTFILTLKEINFLLQNLWNWKLQNGLFLWYLLLSGTVSLINLHFS